MENPTEYTGGEAIVAALAAEGVDTVFGIPGVHNLPLYDALADYPQIHCVTTRHEAGAAFMADGYARASGQPGVCIASAGPGALNMLTPLATAYADSVPVLAVAAQIPSASAGRELGEMHDLNDQRGMLAEVTGWTTTISSPADAAWSVHSAMQRFRTQRPRPIAIEAPVDVLGSSGEVTTVAPITVGHAAASPAQVRQATELLRDSDRVLLIVGGGAVAAADQVVKLAESLQAPVLSTSMGLGIMPWDHPLSLGTGFDIDGTLGRRLTQADIVLSIGCRFTSYTTANRKLRLTGKLVQIDIDPTEIGKHFSPEVALLGDAATVIQQLIDELVERPLAKSASEDFAAIRQNSIDQLADALPLEIGLVRAIRQVLPREGVLSLDMTGLSYWIRRTGIFYRPRQILYPVTFGSLGYGLPAAIGAKLARPNVPLVAICGDAGFQFSIQELATAAQLGLHFPIVVVNDNGYSALRPRQLKQYGRTVAGDLANPDFLGIARAYGAMGLSATPDTLGDSVQRALEAKTCTVIEVCADLRHPGALAEIKSARQAMSEKGRT